MKSSYQPTSYFDLPAPFLELELATPLGDKSRRITGLIDTGYDGEIIVPISIFHELGLETFELSSDYFSVAETASGEQLRLISAYGTATMTELDLTIELVVDTHSKCQEPIIGRKFLENFDLCLLGNSQEFTLQISAGE